MDEERIKLETAKLAKEVGFNEYIKPAFCVNCDDNDFLTENDIGELFGIAIHNSESKFFVSAQSQTIMHKWIRDNYKLYIAIYSLKDGWAFDVRKIKQPSASLTETFQGFSSYEEALECGLQKALEYIKNKLYENK